MNPGTDDPAPAPTPSTGLAEVRYSLPQLLREVELERSSRMFAMEKLDQIEIAKMFSKKKRPRRVPKSGK